MYQDNNNIFFSSTSFIFALASWGVVSSFYYVLHLLIIQTINNKF